MGTRKKSKSSSGCETSACHTWGTGCASCCGAYLKLGEGGVGKDVSGREKEEKTLQQRKNVVRHRLARRKRRGQRRGTVRGLEGPITLDTPTAVLRTRRGARRRALPENWCSRGEHLPSPSALLRLRENARCGVRRACTSRSWRASLTERTGSLSDFTHGYCRSVLIELPLHRFAPHLSSCLRLVFPYFRSSGLWRWEGGGGRTARFPCRFCVGPRRFPRSKAPQIRAAAGPFRVQMACYARVAAGGRSV